MEPDTSEFDKSDDFRCEEKMKVKTHIIVSLTEIIVALAIFGLAFYVFIRNRFYNLILTVLNSIFPSFQISEAVVFALFFGIVLILYALNSEGAFSKIYYLSWILFLPSVLWFSKMDWLQILGLPVNFEVFATDLPFMEVFAVGLVLVSAKIFFFFTSQIKNLRLELLVRGASETDVEKVVFKEFVFCSALIVFCAGGVFVIVVATPLLKTIVRVWLASLIYPHVILGFIVLVTLATCILMYLRSHAEIGEKA